MLLPLNSIPSSLVIVISLIRFAPQQKLIMSDLFNVTENVHIYFTLSNVCGNNSFDYSYFLEYIYNSRVPHLLFFSTQLRRSYLFPLLCVLNFPPLYNTLRATRLPF